MADSILEQRLITEIRRNACLVAAEMIRDGDMAKADLPFNLDNPGDDPHFHEVCKSIARDLQDQMFELIDAHLTGEY
jgi:hypothetical protein